MADNFDWVQTVGYFSLVVIVISLVGLVFFNVRFTGFAVDTTGVVNVSIESTASVSFVDDFIDFSYGQVDAGQTNAVINSWGEAAINGNWSTLTDYMQLENVGNVNATITITSASDADGYIGGTSPAYKMNVTNNEAGSCVNGTAFPTGLGAVVELDTTAQEICAPLAYHADTDTVNISIQLTIPNDATGQKTDTLTAAATAF